MRMIASWVWVFTNHRTQGGGTSLIAPQKAGSPRNRRPGQCQRADVLAAVKAWPDAIGALQRGWGAGPPRPLPRWREAGATANLDSSCARQRVRLAGWDKETAFRLNQETRNKEKEDALNKALDSKPSDSGSHLGDRRECTGRNASERRANLEKDNVRADPAVVPGKADTVGRLSEAHAPPQ